MGDAAAERSWPGLWVVKIQAAAEGGVKKERAIHPVAQADMPARVEFGT